MVDGFPILDYGRSFVFGTAPFNNVRLWVESRTRIIDGDQVHDCLQLGSCKSEDTFAKNDLFYADNYDFLPVLGDNDQWLVFRRKNRVSDRYRSLQVETWGPAKRNLREANRVQVLDSFESIRDATSNGLPIVSRTELADDISGLKAIIEAPVKTMNIHPERGLYQIDTGPVCLPRLDRVYEPPVDCLQLAFVAFNACHFADFVVEQVNNIADESHDPCHVHHFSNPVSFPARNCLIALLD